MSAHRNLSSITHDLVSQAALMTGKQPTGSCADTCTF